MVISKENQEFLEGLIDYYVKEAKSYREIAQEFSSEINSITDTAFGIISVVFIQVFFRHIQIKNKFQIWKIFKSSMR